MHTDGYARPVVLHRPGPAESWPLAQTAGRRVIAEEGRVLTSAGAFAISRWEPGFDADELASRGMPPRVVNDLLLGVVLALREAAAVGVGHGALRGAVVRVGRDGGVTVHGFRGPGERDLADLLDLAATWLDDPPGPLADLLAGPPRDLEAAEAALRRVSATVDGPGLAAWVATMEPDVRLFPHPATGTELAEAAPTPAVPAKVRVAGTAAVTLLLGLAAGALLSSGPSDGGDCEPAPEAAGSPEGR